MKKFQDETIAIIIIIIIIINNYNNKNSIKIKSLFIKSNIIIKLTLLITLIKINIIFI